MPYPTDLLGRSSVPRNDDKNVVILRYVRTRACVDGRFWGGIRILCIELAQMGFVLSIYYYYDAGRFSLELRGIKIGDWVRLNLKF